MKIPASLVDLAAFPISITTKVPLAVPSSQPPFAKRMDPALASFSLEFQFWPTYAGNATNQPHHHVNQLLSNLGERTEETSAIRVGGESNVSPLFQRLDHVHLWFACSLDAQGRARILHMSTPRSRCGTRASWTKSLGPLTIAPTRRSARTGTSSQAICRRAPGTQFTFGLNLYDESQVAAQTQMLAEAFQGSRADLTQNVTLQSIQVGNEPNFYFPKAATYVCHWKSLAQTVLRNIKMGGDGNPTFWIGSEFISFPSTFDLTGTLEAGILDNDDIAYADVVLEEHHYSDSLSIGTIPGGPPPGTLMNKASIRGNLSTVCSGLVHTQSYDKTYYLGEASTYAAEAIFGLSNTVESAVGFDGYRSRLPPQHPQPPVRSLPAWLGFTNGTGIDRPHIMPMYNGLLVVDEMIGTSGHAMVAEIENENSALATYGVWENDKLSRMALINLNVFASDATTRSALNITLSGGCTGGHVTVKRLSIPCTTATEGITWASKSFETDSGVPTGDVIEVPLNGTSVTVAASEIVLLSFH